MRAAILALVFATVAPAHFAFAVLGQPVSLPVSWVLAAGELLVSARTLWLAARALRRFRSAPWPRPVFAGGTR